MSERETLVNVLFPEDSLWDRVASGLSGVARVANDPVGALEDIPYKIRYGMTSGEKHRRSLSGEVPGSTPNPGLEDEDAEIRRASGYFAGKRWPRLAPLVQGGISDARYALGLDDEGDLGAIADEASNVGVNEALREDPSRSVMNAEGDPLRFNALASAPWVDLMNRR